MLVAMFIGDKKNFVFMPGQEQDEVIRVVLFIDISDFC